MKYSVFKYFLIIVLLSGCKKYIRDNQWDTEYALDRNVSISISSTIVHESMVADGKIADNENVYFKIIIKNDGPDVAYFKNFYLEVPGSFDYDANPDQNDLYDSGKLIGGNPYKLKGFIGPNETCTINFGTINNNDYSIKLFAFSTSPPATTQNMVFVLVDKNGKKYKTNIPFETL